MSDDRRRFVEGPTLYFTLILVGLFWIFSGSRGESTVVTPQIAARATAAPASIDSDKRNDAMRPVSSEIGQFGYRAATPIDCETMILFVGGQYIEAPYIVARSGLKVMVNGVVVRQIKWPGSGYVATDPQTPVGLDRTWTLKRLKESGPNQSNFIALKARFFYSHFAPAEATKRYVSYFESLPCVEKVLQEPEPGTTMTNVTIFSVHGESESMLTGDRDGRPKSVDEVIGILEREVRYLTKRITAGGFAYTTRSYDFSCGPESEVYLRLPEIIETLESTNDIAWKVAQLAMLMEKPEHEIGSWFKPLVDGYRRNKQLDFRILRIKVDNE